MYAKQHNTKRGTEDLRQTTEYRGVHFNLYITQQKVEECTHNSARKTTQYLSRELNTSSRTVHSTSWASVHSLSTTARQLVKTYMVFSVADDQQRWPWRLGCTAVERVKANAIAIGGVQHEPVQCALPRRQVLQQLHDAMVGVLGGGG